MKKHIYIYLIYTIGWGSTIVFPIFSNSKLIFFLFLSSIFAYWKIELINRFFHCHFVFAICILSLLFVHECIYIYNQCDQCVFKRQRVSHFQFFILFVRPRLLTNEYEKIIKEKLNYWLWQIMNYHAFKINSINVIGKCLWRLINSIGSQTVWTIIIIRNDGLCRIYVNSFSSNFRVLLQF